MVGGVLFTISKNAQFLKGYLLEANGISGRRVMSMCIDIDLQCNYNSKINNERYRNKKGKKKETLGL